MPTFYVAGAIGHCKPPRLHEIDGDLYRNVCDRIAVTRNKFALGKFAVEQLEKPGHARPVRIGPSRNLRYLQLFHRWMRMAEDRCHVREKVYFCPPIPHLHDGDVFRPDAEHWRLRMQ